MGAPNVAGLEKTFPSLLLMGLLVCSLLWFNVAVIIRRCVEHSVRTCPLVHHQRAQSLMNILSYAVKSFSVIPRLVASHSIVVTRCSTLSRVSTWMGDSLWAGKPFHYVISRLGQLSLPSLRGK